MGLFGKEEPAKRLDLNFFLQKTGARVHAGTEAARQAHCGWERGS